MVSHKFAFKRITGLIVLPIFAFALVDYAIGGELGEGIQRTRGKYMGHKWYIDRNHLIWWDDKPYVRYGFTGNGDIDRFMELGFDQFNVGPNEELWVFSDDPRKNKKAVQDVDVFTDELVARGATYYAALNGLWPWRGSGRIDRRDMAEYVFKKVWNITGFSGMNKSIELSFTAENQIDFDTETTKIYLFDMSGNEYTDISEKLKSLKISREKIKESPGEIYTAKKYTLVFESFLLPQSEDLRVTMLSHMFAEMVPGIYPSAFPALWKPRVTEYYKRGLESFKKPYAKEGLRGLMFADEINTNKTSLLGSRIYVNFDNDEVALNMYQDWLKEKFRTIDVLNDYLQTRFDDFSGIRWRVSVYPFMERDLGRDDNPYRAVKKTFGLFESPKQLERIDRLQDEFRVWFYGYWMARYAKMAKEIIGDVPVFLASAGMGGNADDYLQIHRHAMLQGIDGLIRNHYAQVRRAESGEKAFFQAWSNRRFPLETVTGLLDSVQKESGRTKAYFANEFGWAEKSENAYEDIGLGGRFSFRSKEDLRDFLNLLIDNGYKGFNMFKMNPNAETARREVRWLSELKQEMIKKTIRTINYNKKTEASEDDEK